MRLTQDERLAVRVMVMGQSVRGRNLSSVEIIALNSELARCDAQLQRRGASHLVRELINEYRGTQTH